MDYVLSLDQGTTSSRSVLFRRDGTIQSIFQREFEQIYPEAGWVEHRPRDIWSSQIQTAKSVLGSEGINASQLASIGITNQRETTLLWDREAGDPLYNAIVWQDRRTAAYCDELKEKGYQRLIRKKTGLLLDPYFSATKIRWILDNVEGVRDRVREGTVAFGTVDSWLIWKLTGGRLHVTDPTNASRTLLYNIYSGEWDPELLDLFGIPPSLLPAVESSSELLGETAPEILGSPVPISGIAGDQQASLFGQQCVRRGMAKNTYGTGNFLLMNIGQKPELSENRLLTTIAWDVDGEVTYALEGSVFVGGAVVKWLRDELGIIETVSEVEALARSVDSADGVYFVPAFTGLGAPHWEPEVRGTITGLTQGVGDAHLARAALNSIAHQSMDVLQAMEADVDHAVTEIRADGGAATNDLLLQIQSNLLGSPVIRPTITESTARGSAFLAGLAVGFWKSYDELQDLIVKDRRFERKVDSERVEELRDGWKLALKKAKLG